MQENLGTLVNYIKVSESQHHLPKPDPLGFVGECFHSGVCKGKNYLSWHCIFSICKRNCLSKERKKNLQIKTIKLIREKVP